MADQKLTELPVLDPVTDPDQIYIVRAGVSYQTTIQAVHASIVPGAAVWGDITGTLGNQTDLQNALNAKAGTGVVTGAGLTMSTARLLGRTTASTGAIEEITVGAGLSLSAGALTATATAPAWGTITGTLSAQTDLNTALGLKAPLASPALTGVPTAPTASLGTNTTQIATTAFVIANGGTGTVTSVSSANGDLTVATGTTTPVLTVVSAPKWTTARNLAGNSVDGSGNVAFANKFIVQGTADSGLSAAQFLGALATGIVKNTTTTGVLSIAVAGDFPTLNQNTTGSAATLTIPRAINGVNFDGSAAITVTAAAGTLTGTVLNATVVTSTLATVGDLTTGSIGTGFVVKGVTLTLGSDANYDLYYRNSSGVLTRLANGTTGQFLGATTSNAPSWGTPAGTGTVTSVTSANGDATVATTTTTPVITIVSAPKLTTARNINGVAFDGTGNITVTVPIATGVTGLGTGVATFLATPSSANLAAALTDETGTGVAVFSASPALTGTPTAPTASAGTNSTQLATTAFVAAASIKVIQLACSDVTTLITTGTNKATFRMPFAMTLTAVRASEQTASGGADVIIDINKNGTTVLSTKLSIDAGETTSLTAATPPVISVSALADDDIISIDFDQVGAGGGGKEVIVTLIGTSP